MAQGLIKEYCRSRQEKGDWQLTHTISMAADIIIKIYADFYKPELIDDAWDMAERLIKRYAEGRCNNG